MTSLNISLPEALKQYVEGQVASGDWGTPSEYVRELIRQDKERRLENLEQVLVAAAKGTKIELPVAEIRRKGLITVLRERTRGGEASSAAPQRLSHRRHSGAGRLVLGSVRRGLGWTLGKGRDVGRVARRQSARTGNALHF